MSEFSDIEEAKQYALSDLQEETPELLKCHTTAHSFEPPTPSQVKFLGGNAPDAKTRRDYQLAICQVIANSFMTKCDRAEDTEMGRHYINKLLAKKNAGLLLEDLSEYEIRELTFGEVTDLFYNHTMSKEQKLYSQNMVRQIKMKLS